MAYLYIEDFRGALDRRKSRAAGVPGTLWECTDGHITRGGEIEKRKAWVSTYSLPTGTFGMKAASGALIVFGSAADPGVPAGVTYQRLQHPDTNLSMTALVSADVYGGKVYAIARFSDNSLIHFYDGAVVADWINGVVRADMTNNSGIAEHLRVLINAHADYTATRANAVITITGPADGTAFTVTGIADNGEGNAADNQSLTIATTTTPIEDISEVLATASFSVVAGTSGAGNQITNITVDGVSILTGAVLWATSHTTTAALVADDINTKVSTPEYSATVSGTTVTIRSATGSGATPNGLLVVVTVGGDLIVSPTSGILMAGGVTAAVGRAQVSTVEVGGTFEVGDRFTVILGDDRFGADANPSPVGNVVLTHDSKVYSAAGSVLNFSGVDEPTGWNREDDAGAGFINLANRSSGSETLTALGEYQGSLAAFARSAIQIWNMDTDPVGNVLQQTLSNIGTRAPDSVIPYGNEDTFFLSDSGVRSLRARDSSNVASVNDIGTPIDPLVLDALATLDADTIAAARGVMEPVDGRYWLALGTTVYVFSFFPGAKVSGWSTYTVPAAVDALAVLEGRVYVRCGDTIYLYGGQANATYDSTEVTVVTPYFDAGKPGHDKNVYGVGFSATNTWTMSLLVDPDVPATEILIGDVSGTRYPLDLDGAEHVCTHFAVKMVCAAAGAARIANMAIYYNRREEN